MSSCIVRNFREEALTSAVESTNIFSLGHQSRQALPPHRGSSDSSVYPSSPPGFVVKDIIRINHHGWDNPFHRISSVTAWLGVFTGNPARTRFALDHSSRHCKVKG